MKNIKKIIQDNKLTIIVAIATVIVGIIILSIINFNSKNTKLNKFENDSYVIQYDKAWHLKQTENNTIELKNKNANVEINIVELKDESRYSSVDDLIDELIYNIEKQNPDYKFLSKKEATISKSNFKGYKLLYETDTNQVMVTLYKKGDKLIIINYESKNEYFDIFLDSVQNIIYNFDTKEKVYDLSNKITLDTNEIIYSTDDELDSKLGELKTYEIANNNYYVKYSLPNNFLISDYDSQNGYFNLKGIDKKDIIIKANIYKSNIFEILDKDNSVNVYSDYKYKKDSEDYSEFNETITKKEDKEDIYLYKNSYFYDKAVTYDKDFKKQEYKRKDENVKIIYALNKNHVLVITIEATGTNITKKLIDSIKVEEIKNYSSYTTSVIDGDNIKGILKRYTDYSKKTTDEIVISLPKKYKEIQQYNDIYSERIYGLNYDEDNDLYDYKIDYTLTSSYSKVEDIVKNKNSSFSTAYGDYNYLSEENAITVNNKNFLVYSGGYTQLGGIMFTNINRFKYYTNKKVLFYELSDGGYVVIEISGNGKEITNEVINDATNFEINKIDN